MELIIPSAGNDEVGGRQERDGFDGLGMGTDLGWWSVVGGLLAEFPHADGVVGSSGEYCGSVGGEGGAEDRGTVFVVYLSLGKSLNLPTLLLNFPTPDPSIPIGTYEDIGGGRPGHAGDAVSSCLWDAVVWSVRCWS